MIITSMRWLSRVCLTILRRYFQNVLMVWFSAEFSFHMSASREKLKQLKESSIIRGLYKTRFKQFKSSKLVNEKKKLSIYVQDRSLASSISDEKVNDPFFILFAWFLPSIRIMILNNAVYQVENRILEFRIGVDLFIIRRSKIRNFEF